MSNTTNNEAQGFDSFYEQQARSVTIRAIFRETLGLDGLSDEIAPYSFVTLDDLEDILHRLDIGEGELLADIACGNGSLGLWLAQTSGADLIGVDPSASAIEIATDKANRLGLSRRASFRTGRFEDTTLADNSVDAVVSIDAVWLAADQQTALNELARVLKKDGKLVFTSWEQHIQMPFVKQAVSDYRPLLERAGFEVVSYDHMLHSENLQLAIYEQIRTSQQSLIAEMGDAIKGLIGEAHFVPGMVDGVNYISPENGPHILATAKRK